MLSAQDVRPEYARFMYKERREILFAEANLALPAQSYRT